MSLLAATIPVQAVSLLVGDNGVATHLGLLLPSSLERSF